MAQNTRTAVTRDTSTLWTSEGVVTGGVVHARRAGTPVYFIFTFSAIVTLRAGASSSEPVVLTGLGAVGSILTVKECTGYNGIFCENDIDECLSNPCLEGGTCQNLNNAFKCECIAPYTGTFCDEMIACLVKPCLNSGICNDNGTCSCVGNFIGPTCEMFTGTPSPDTTNWTLIGGIIGGVILLLVLVFVVIIILNIRQQRATAGTYSPSRQEMSGSRVEMDNVLKLPPQERLI